MAKGNRNRQQARAKLAQMRALEARRRTRRRWLAGAGAVVVVAAVAVAITLGVTSGSGNAAPSPGPVGSEGVPVPNAAPLASTATSAAGQPVDGITCQTNEQTLFHIHAHLAIVVDGAARQVPAAIGIPGAQTQNTPNGPFIASGRCFYWLHTHAPDGIIHIESPVHRIYTLGDFFDEWRQPLSRTQVAGAKGQVTAFVNGKPWTKDPRAIPLVPHAAIQLDVGSPAVAAQAVSWAGANL